MPRARPSAFIDPVRALSDFASGGARIQPTDAPRVSIVIPTAGATAWLELALAALAAHTEAGGFEVLVTDDASPDPRATAAVVAPHPGVSLSRSEQSRGFAASVNAAVRSARAPLLCVLNDDVVVTPGWLEALLAELDADPRAAWVGPVCNDSGDVGTVHAEYQNMHELLEFAARASGRTRAVEKLALHAALIRRASYEAVGGLDEGYQRGMFEDDDLAAALRARGERVLLAPRVFVHHAAGATLRALSPFTYFACFEVNRRRFEGRWGVRWRVHDGAQASRSR
ncbi:MAG: glycosyltransferase [Myxococcales bacterium]|nr:glycosyltransferase [Myxococcales bacterium]